MTDFHFICEAYFVQKYTPLLSSQVTLFFFRRFDRHCFDSVAIRCFYRKFLNLDLETWPLDSDIFFGWVGTSVFI